MESRSSGVGTKLPLSLDRKGKVLVEFRKKVGDLWVASCGSPRVLAPWAGLESEVKGNESGSCSVCIRNLITKKYVKGDGYWKQELVLGNTIIYKDLCHT